jgi:ABC-2 type transport system ATP-binding protein
MLIITSLSKHYGSSQILNNINLRFARGEIHGIVGENGAGKTTLFKCITGLESSQGTIEYENGILKNVTGFLPDIPFFFSRMTGLEYLRLISNARGIQIKNFDDINFFELPLNKYAETYSTGMQKKLAITGLLIQKNEVFILDEPFNGVDISSNIVITSILNRLKEQNKIVVISSHIFSTLSDSCDYLHYLQKGYIKQSAAKGNFDPIENDLKNVMINNSKLDSIF